MAAQYKTQCPHCGAQFRISEDDLGQAKGKVRCGSCLEVFLATRNLIDNQGNPIKLREQQQASEQQGGSPQERQEQGQQRPPGQEKAPQPSDAKPADSDAEDWTLPGQDEQPADQPENTQPNEDKHKDYIPANDTAVSLGNSELSESFLSMDEEGSDTDHDFSEIGGGGDTDESWAEQLLEELEDEEPSSKDRGKQTAQPPVNESMSLLDEWSDEDDDEKLAAASPAGEAAADGNPEEDKLDLFSLDAAARDRGEPDFVEIDAPQDETARKLTLPGTPSFGLQRLKWGAVSLLALAVLGIQFLAFNFSELARQPDWRPLYAQACGLLGCQLPRRANINKLRGANLVVRSHPEVADALVVDAILFNEAKYPQPFPQLELTFSTLANKPVASRRFQPSEYRAGELAKLEAMPPEVPIHVSFEILDPGPKAVNYSLSFHPPKTGNHQPGDGAG